jgi:hypothetical protein
MPIPTCLCRVSLRSASNALVLFSYLKPVHLSSCETAVEERRFGHLQQTGRYLTSELLSTRPPSRLR